MREMFYFFGTLAILLGLVWIGQGMGYIQWPASSFMINQTRWIYYGCFSVLIGMYLIWLIRRKK